MRRSALSVQPAKILAAAPSAFPIFHLGSLITGGGAALLPGGVPCQAPPSHRAAFRSGNLQLTATLKAPRVRFTVT